MKFFGVLITLVIGCTIFSCAAIQPMKKDAKKEFTFDYILEGKNKTDIWKSARNFFAGAYGDSRSVFRVMDEDAGSILGKGVSSWMLLTNRCATEYHIRFMAKDGKARLQFELIAGIPAGSDCTGWPLPTESGYKEIINEFEIVSEKLELALKGSDDMSDFSDF